MRNLFELLYYFRELLLVLLAVLVSLMLLLTGESRQSFALQDLFTGMIGMMPRTNLGFADIISYKEENQVLRHRLMQYALLNAELVDAARENERLRDMLQFTEESPYELQVAEVISRGASSILSTITLNVGTRHGVEPNFPVLALNGLLGKTISVAPNASIVQLITDRNFRLSVKVGSEGIRGILVPLYGPFAEVTGIPLNSDVRPGDQVLTSGFSDIYPKNLPVALVDEVEVTPGENFSRVTVRIQAEPSEAEHVFIMIDHGPGT
ncbi:MAG: rod shape-determining protein MreC [Fidelibacterota bacterium]|nr:MAG: rod shape-determining protein MreC [Candidatus Neomarinimicrobiota bacterium]